MRGWVAVAGLLAGCPYDPDPSLIDASRVRADGAWFDDAGVPYCWIFECPTDVGAEVCGTCVDPYNFLQCPPGFLCTCERECVKGPWSYDAVPITCNPDAADLDAATSPDARLYDWPTCNYAHIPGT